MNRVRWFETAWPYSMRTLASRLKEYTFGAESNDGFLVERECATPTSKGATLKR